MIYYKQIKFVPEKKNTYFRLAHYITKYIIVTTKSFKKNYKMSNFLEKLFLIFFKSFFIRADF